MTLLFGVFDIFIKFILTLSVLGGLNQAMQFLVTEAANNHARGTLSLSKLSKELQGEEKYCSWYTSTYKKPCSK